MVARSRDGSISSFPVTETIHKNNICYITQTPARIPEEIRQKAQEMAEKAVSCLEGEGQIPPLRSLTEAAAPPLPHTGGALGRRWHFWRGDVSA